MDTLRWTIALDSMFIFVLTLTGIVYGQLDSDDITYDDGLENGDEFQLVTRDSPSYSTFDPYYDWLKLETADDNDHTLVNLLKRSGLRLAGDSYSRYPRIKERRIIPFYSYDNVQSKYKARPRFMSRFRPSVPYTPWNWPVFNNNRYFKHPPIYSSYRK